jgi:transcriptional regulator with XRE-family HTH domain
MDTRVIPYSTIVGGILVEMRNDTRMSQSEMAQISDISQSAVARMELGRSCTLENLRRMAKVYECNLSLILAEADQRAELLKAHGLVISDETPDADWKPWFTSTLVNRMTLRARGQDEERASGGMNTLGVLHDFFWGNGNGLDTAVKKLRLAKAGNL